MSATTRPSAPTPTAPGSLPLIGHAHRFARGPLAYITSLCRYGSVGRIRIGPSPAYGVTDPALTRRVLVTDTAHFPKGGRIIDALRPFFGDGLAIIADGEAHLRNRRLVQPMFNKSHIADRGDAMIRQVRTMAEAWPQGAPRDVYADMNATTLAAFLVALFGTDLPDRLESEFTSLMPEIMKGTIRQTILPSWITGLPLPANRAHAARVARLRTLIDQAIDHHSRRATHPEEDETGAVPAQCPHASAPPTRQSGLFAALLTAETPVSRQQLQDEAITLLTGAIETTGTTLSWALYEISRDPGIERLLRAELALVCADHPLRHEDLDRLVHARRVLQEAVRKYGPAWMVARTASRDTELGGHRIPEGADVVWSPHLHQHDPEVFPAPDVFDPDRWALTARRPHAAPSWRSATAPEVHR